MSTLTAIVTSYNRPNELEVCLRSLKNQRKSSNRNDHQELLIIVTDNSENNKETHEIVHKLNCGYVQTRATDCYTAAEMVIDLVTTDFICFPSDDNWYAPEFAYRLLLHADRYGCGFVYCDMLYDPRYYGEWNGKYNVVKCQPKTCFIDKGGFVIRTDLFKSLGGFPNKPFNPKSEADGQLAELVVKCGAKVGYVEELLWFHG